MSHTIPKPKETSIQIECVYNLVLGDITIYHDDILSNSNIAIPRYIACKVIIIDYNEVVS